MDGEVRLVGGSNDAEGTIEICFGSLWGAISATTWTEANTQVTCKQLGFTGQVTSKFYKMANEQNTMITEFLPAFPLTVASYLFTPERVL